MPDENKAAFTKRLCRLLSRNTRAYSDITDISYVVENYDENVYVTYKNGHQRKINVNCDSCSGILNDFLAHCNDSDAAISGTPRPPEPFNGNFFEILEDTFTVKQINQALEYLITHNVVSKEDNNEEIKDTIKQLFKLSCEHLNDDDDTA